jgi:hypothetical protein
LGFIKFILDGITWREGEGGIIDGDSLSVVEEVYATWEVMTKQQKTRIFQKDEFGMVEITVSNCPIFRHVFLEDTDEFSDLRLVDLVV